MTLETRVFGHLWNVDNDSDVTSVSRFFQVRAATTGKAWLTRVDSWQLDGWHYQTASAGSTKRSMGDDCDYDYVILYDYYDWLWWHLCYFVAQKAKEDGICIVWLHSSRVRGSFPYNGMFFL